jgi:ferredoxin/flavodoxin---NADP+ reductase
MTRWVEGSVVNLRQWTEELYSLQVRADIDPFIAGQFTRIAREIGGEIIARPYSFVNAPDNPVLEFYFITVPAGPLSHELIHLGPGDSILVAPRAAGFFILRELPDAEFLWMLATGTAIGPFLSILGTREAWERFRKIILVHSVRSARELTYQDTLGALLEQHPEQLQVIPMVSRETVGHALGGRVTRAIEDGRLEARAGLSLDPGSSQVMICGNPAMVHDTTHLLEKSGFRKNRRREPGHITTEQYWKE